MNLSDPIWLARESLLVEKARTGDGAALTELYRAFAPLLYRQVLMPRLANAQAAEDALADTFRVALERLEQFRPKGLSIYFWLAAIARNKATDMHRVKSTTRRALTNFEQLLAPLQPKAAGPETEVLVAQEDALRKKAVAATLQSINPRYAKAIVLRFIDDRPRKECADLMEVKLGTFDVVLLRALRAFRTSWERYVEGEGLGLEQRP